MNTYEKTLKKELQGRKLGQPLYFYEETDSTNDRIRELAAKGAVEGTLAVAERQSAGRGRSGRAWEAPAGEGIWMSLLLRPCIAPAQASVLTLLAGLAICEAIETETGLQAGLKWPNDILLNGKKLVGILTEMDCDMEKIHSITLGIGINVQTEVFSEELREIATSLLLESGKRFDRAALAGAVLEAFTGLYEAFVSAGGSFAPFRERYGRKCLNIGKEVLVIGRETYAAQALDITSEGELLVKRMDTGKTEVVFSGEVSIRENRT